MLQRKAAASILPPHMAWQNIELIAIFRHGAPGDRNAALAENLDHLVIAQRRAAILVFHQVKNGFFHTDVAQRVTGRGLIPGREEVFHLEYALWRRHVFAGHSAAYCGLVHAHCIGNLSHSHWLQMRGAMFKEIALP